MAERTRKPDGLAQSIASRFQAQIKKVGRAIGASPLPASAQLAPTQFPMDGRLPAAKSSIVGLPRKPILSYAQGNYTAMAVLTELYSKIAESRREYLMQHDQIRGFYLVEAILNGVADDAMTPEVTTGEIIQLTSPKDNVRRELEALQKQIQLDQIIGDIMIELLAYGEYNLRLQVEKGQGVVAVHDDVDQETVVAMYSHGFPEVYLWANPMSGMLDILPPWGLANFVLGKHRLRINVHDEVMQQLQQAHQLGANKELEVWANIPKYTRVGRPLLYGTLGKIAELQTLEALVPAMKISRLATGSIVTITIPGSTNPKDAMEITKQYEEAMNRKINIDRDNRKLSVSELVSMSAEIKVIPVSENRGQLERNDVRGAQEAADLLRGIQDDRNAICSSIGFPTELLFGGDEQGKTNVLKRYARYVRVLKSVQTCVVQGCRQIGLAHLANKGVNVVPEDIVVQFNNQLVDVDQLEVLEYTDATINVIQSVNDFLGTIQGDDPESSLLDPEGYRKWLARNLALISKEDNLIKTKGPAPEPSPQGGEPGQEPPPDRPEPDDEPDDGDEPPPSDNQDRDKGKAAPLHSALDRKRLEQQRQERLLEQHRERMRRRRSRPAQLPDDLGDVA